MPNLPKTIAAIVLALCSVQAAGAAEIVKDFGPAEFLPRDFGAVACGFQDDFSSYTQTTDPSAATAELSANGWLWVSTGNSASPCTITSVNSRSVLHVGAPGGSATDNNHLLYVPNSSMNATYDGDSNYNYTTGAQEVLMHVRVTRMTSSNIAGAYTEQVHAGMALRVDAGTSKGVDLVFERQLSSSNLRFFQVGNGNSYSLDSSHTYRLKDPALSPSDPYVRWSQPGNSFSTPSPWYWLRLEYDADAELIRARAWPSGTVEPSDIWHFEGTVASFNQSAGWAGLTASCDNTTAFDVDYFLVKSQGLPKIVVGVGDYIPEPVTIVLLTLGGLVMLRRRR